MLTPARTPDKENTGRTELDELETTNESQNEHSLERTYLLVAAATSPRAVVSGSQGIAHL
jgi:hypothetical protein